MTVVAVVVDDDAVVFVYLAFVVAVLLWRVALIIMKTTHAFNVSVLQSIIN